MVLRCAALTGSDVQARMLRRVIRALIVSIVFPVIKNASLTEAAEASLALDHTGPQVGL
jgi:hypothetical protein